MKMNKRVLSLLLAVVMVLGAFTTVFAAEDKVEEVKKVQGIENKIQYLVDFKHVEGYEDGKLKLDQHINRAEITKLIVHAEGYKELAERLQGVMKLYTDVDTSHWANGVISVGTTKNTKANNLEMLNGYPNGTFKPAQDVTYAELAKMLVVLVKEDLTKAMHDRANTPQRWAGDWMLWAEELGILEDVKVENSNAAASRRDAFVMMYNAMYKMKFVDRVPANETMGIVSGFDRNNEKLTLNQGDFKKEFNLTKDTVYVRYDANKKHETVYKLANYYEDIYEYSYGSLVRVLADDKGNVTHIVELGNEKGAINSVNWTDIAKKTTALADKVKFEDNNMFDMDGKKLELTKATRYFIADPAKGRLSEVTKADAKEFGLKEKVYAGYDVLEKRTGIQETKEAKVIVFTKATKAADTGRNLRVVQQQTNVYKLALENVKGEREDFETRTNQTLFPFIDGVYLGEGAKLQKYDVVNVAENVVGGTRVNVKIRHKETDDFPIVKVIDVKGRDIKIQAADKTKTAWLRLDADADVFTRGVKEDDVIQFRTNKVEGRSNRVEIVSILPANTQLKGIITNVIFENNKLHKGIIVNVNDNTVSIKDIDGYGDINVFEHDEVAKLRQLLNKEVEFLVRPGTNYDLLAYNFQAKGATENAQLKVDALAALADYEEKVGKTDKVNVINSYNEEQAKDAKDEIEAAYKANVKARQEFEKAQELGAEFTQEELDRLNNWGIRRANALNQRIEANAEWTKVTKIDIATNDIIETL